MTAIFVHGVPDTYHIWDRVRQQLSGITSVALRLPGFGCPVPDGFTATKEAYTDWIIDQIEQQPEPVDLVGHDWGCIMTMRVASLRPDLVRTWAAGSGPVSRGYEWHEWAKVWQTPSAGEKWMADMTVPKFSQLLEGLGLPADVASETAARIDDVMKDCILRLYRSAVSVGSEWEPGLADITSRGLVFWGTEDAACPIRFADSLAARTNAARVLRLDCGHWTPVLRAGEIADALRKHWRAADSS